jgi:glutathione synthase/RimK-type ligase-like ATP-grasp enzyme
MSFRVKLRTKNSSADNLKAMLRDVRSSVPFVVRLGSRTPIEEIFPRNYSRAVQINSIEGISNSRDKTLMKQCFDRGEVKSAPWRRLNEANDWNVFPAIIKQRGSHGGDGIYMVENEAELAAFRTAHGNMSAYIIEEYKNFTKEYRLHVDKDGCFYTCRKMLKSDATERWHRHDSNSVWIMEENPLFERPSNWDDIVHECVKALNATGLTLGACDVKVQTEKGKARNFVPDFIVMEINSAPAMGEVTTVKYFEKIKEIVENHA